MISLKTVGLSLADETVVDFNLKRLSDETVLTVVFSRKKVENGYELNCSLEKELPKKLPEELVEPLKKSNGLLKRTHIGKERARKKVLSIIRRDFTLEIRAKNNQRVWIIVNSDSYGRREAFINKNQIELFTAN